MSKAKKNDPENEVKKEEIIETAEVSEEETAKDTEEELSDEEKLLKAKEERFYGKDREEEVEEEEIPDTAITKAKKKVGFFVDYYKWFVIIPAIIIIIAVVMITSYISESRERALELSIINAKYDIPNFIYAVENDYTKYTGEDITGKDIRIEIDLQYPDTSSGEENFSQSEIVSMQKFNASVIASRVDVALTNPWVINDYSVTDATLDLRELFDEEFLQEHENIVYYAKDSTGEKIPVAFYINAPVVKESYEDDVTPLVVSFDSSNHKKEARLFMEWLLEQSTDELTED